MWWRYLDAPCRIRGHQKPHDVTFLVLSLLTLSVDHEERAALVIFELSSGGVATVAVLMNKGSGRQAWSRPSTTIPLYFLPLYYHWSSHVVYGCVVLFGPGFLTIARRLFFVFLVSLGFHPRSSCYKPVHASVMSPLHSASRLIT